MNDRMLLESRCNKSSKVGQQTISAEEHFVFFLVWFHKKKKKEIISRIRCEMIHILSFDRKYTDHTGIYSPVVSGRRAIYYQRTFLSFVFDVDAYY